MNIFKTTVLLAALTVLLVLFGNLIGGQTGMLIALVLAIVVPIAAVLIQMAISRSREYAADAGAGRLCGRPHTLASALRKLSKGVRATPMTGGSPAMSSLFIVHPFAGGIAVLFSTHPPMEKRIERLEALSRDIRRAS